VSFFSRAHRVLAVVVVGPLATIALSGAEVTALPTQPRLAASTRYPIPASIASDCSTDVSADLNAFFASVPDSARIVFPTDGCFRTETQVLITGKSNWVIEGNGSLFRRTEPTPVELQYPNNNRHIGLVLNDHLTVRNLKVTGLNVTSDIVGGVGFGSYLTALGFEHGFAVLGSTNVTLDHVAASDVYGDFIYLAPSFAVRTTGVTILGGRFDRNGRQGITILANRVLIDGVDIDHSRRAGFDFEPNTPSNFVQDIEIRRSTVLSHLRAFSAGGTGAVDNVNIHNNTVLASAVPVFYGQSNGHTRDNWTVRDNVVVSPLGAPGAPIWLWNAQNALVARNTIRVDPRRSMYALDVGAGTTAALRCNWFPGVVVDLVRSDGTASVKSSDNSVTNAPPPCLASTAVDGRTA
jgi:hypothetical protein